MDFITTPRVDHVHGDINLFWLWPESYCQNHFSFTRCKANASILLCRRLGRVLLLRCPSLLYACDCLYACDALLEHVHEGPRRNALGRGRSLSSSLFPDARRRARALSLFSFPRALCARSDQIVETVDQILAAIPLTLCPPKSKSQVNVTSVCQCVCVSQCV